jgi:hypothetical protein
MTRYGIDLDIEVQSCISKDIILLESVCGNNLLLFVLSRQKIAVDISPCQISKNLLFQIQNIVSKLKLKIKLYNCKVKLAHM